MSKKPELTKLGENNYIAECPLCLKKLKCIAQMKSKGKNVVFNIQPLKRHLERHNKV